jgi:hypothetical protein
MILLLEFTAVPFGEVVAIGGPDRRRCPGERLGRVLLFRVLQHARPAAVPAYLPHPLPLERQSECRQRMFGVQGKRARKKGKAEPGEGKAEPLGGRRPMMRGGAPAPAEVSSGKHRPRAYVWAPSRAVPSRPTPVGQRYGQALPSDCVTSSRGPVPASTARGRSSDGAWKASSVVGPFPSGVATSGPSPGRVGRSTRGR